MDLAFLQPLEIQESKDFLRQLGLKDNASDTRAKILSCWESVDIPSCPGSGKTTILVTKLAWAIERWKADDAGICVLSHTNVAKDEIKKRLTNNQASKLLANPHFVGTIHEFFNKFLAIPWLKSRNMLIKYIDNEVGYQKCLDSVWIVDEKRFDREYKKKFLRQNYTQSGNLTKLSWSIDNDGKLQIFDAIGEFAEFQKCLKTWCTKQGYHTHDDMIAFSKRLLIEYPDLAVILRDRFPVVLIDEAQDTNELQSKLLRDIFDPEKMIVQRFGDEDQQIFDFGAKAITYPFPTKRNDELCLNETQRCSPLISSVANKFSLSGIIITSVCNNDKQPNPCLILFDKDTATQVIAKFAELVQDNVKLKEDSVIKVVGQIGQGELKDKKFPQTICHYEPTYIKPTNIRIGRPKTLQVTIKITKESFFKSNENNISLNIFFSGILRLLAEPLNVSNITSFPYRVIKQKLETDEMNFKDLHGRDLFDGLVQIYSDIIGSKTENKKIKTDLEELLRSSGFKNYNQAFFSDAGMPNQEIPDVRTINGIPIEINTIAGIKGETHTATLVLETFFYDHNIKSAILAMLAGSQKGRQNERIQKKVKHLYVAITRPTDFLCLALPKYEYEELHKIPAIGGWLDKTFTLKDLTTK